MPAEGNPATRARYAVAPMYRRPRWAINPPGAGQCLIALLIQVDQTQPNLPLDRAGAHMRFS